MAFYETLDNRLRRQQEDRARYPELEVTDYDGIAEVDAYSRTLGQEPTSFGQAAEDASVRLGFSPEEVGLIESIAAPPSGFATTPPRIPGFGFGGGAVFGGIGGPPEREPAFGTGITGEEIEAVGDRFSTPGIRAVEHEVIRLRNERPDLLELGGEDFLQGVAIENLLRPGTRGLGELGAEVAREEFEPDRLRSQAAIQPAVERDVGIEPVREIGRQVGRVAQETGATDTLAVMLDGEAFINEFVNLIMFPVTGDSEAFDIREQDWYKATPRIVQEIVRALAPINLAAAGEGAVVTLALRTAAKAKGRSVAARKALNGLAQLTEPFAARSIGGRIGTEVAAEVGAVEGTRIAGELTEGAPAPVRVVAQVAGLFAGGAAGGLSPEIIKSAKNVPIGGSVRVVGDDGAIQGPLTELEAVQATVRDALARGQRLVETGEPAAALKRQQAGQAAGIERTTPTAATFAEATTGARVSDPLSQQQPLPKMELSPTQEEVLVGEAARLLREGEISPFDIANARTVVERLRDGLPPRPSELASENLRKIFGDDVMNAWGSAARRAPGGELPPARSIISGQAAANRLPGSRQVFRTPVANVPSASGSLPPLPRADATEQLAKGFEDVRIKELNARNKEEAKVLRQTDRFNELAVTRQTNALDAAEARSFAQGAVAKQRILNTAPNSDELLQRVGDLMNRPSPGTPKADATGLAPIPRVSSEIQEVVRTSIEYWLRATDAILGPMADGGVGTIRAVQAYGLGQLESPYLTAAVQRMHILRGVLNTLGMDNEAAAKVANLMISHQFARRYGDGFTEIRIARLGDARVRARARVRADAHAAGGPIPTGNDLTRLTDDLVDEELESMFRETHGALVDTERRVNGQMERTKPTENFRALETFVQRTKNSMFAIDASIVGIQLRSAIIRGGVPLLARAIMKLADTMLLPNARHIYTEGLLPKQIQAALDGVDQTSLTSAFRQDEGSLMAYSLPQKVPGIPQIEQKYSAAANRINEISFGTALTSARNWAYEGELFTLHLLGEDITDPLVRQTAAISANNIGSSSAVAVRSDRNRFETIMATSVRMSRARAKNVELMARVFDPRSGVSSAERKLGAMMIVSTVGSTLFMGHVVNNLIGMDEFEFDPGLPGFGLITIPDGAGGGRVIDLFPQDSVIRAFARSIDALKDGDADEAINQWLKVYVGSASIVGKLPATVFDYGYEAGRGFTDDLTTKGTILNLLPLPIPIINGIAEGWDSIGVALESLGIGEFDESVFSEEDRLLRDAGFDPDAIRGEEGFIDSSQRDAELQKLGELEQLQTRDEEETREQAKNGIRDAQARLVSFDLRNSLNVIAYGEDGELIAKPLYRELRRDPQAEAISQRRHFQDVYDSWGESDDPIRQLASARWALVKRAEHPITKAVNWELLEELQGSFDAELEPSDREAMMQIINAVNVNDNPLEREFDQLRADLGNSGWWELDEVLWSEIVESNTALVQGATDIRDLELKFKDTVRKDARQQGFAAGEIEGLVRSAWSSHPIHQEWIEDRRERRADWALSSIANLELASQASEWAFWAPPDDVEGAFSRALGPAR